MIARDVVVNEQAFWNWEKQKVELHSNDSLKGRRDATSRLHVSYEDGSDSEVDYPILKIRSLAEIYERCNMVNMEPSNYQELEGYVDSDWAGNAEDMKSTSGYLFFLGSGPFSWISKKQEVVAQSTVEAEYITAAAASNQAIWLRRLLADFGKDQSEATFLWCDNKSAIAIANNPVQHGRTKHILVKFHAIREAERNHEMKLVHCKSEQ
ncbi:hypothetical protein GH714_011113 [Hevea brasiliensis]|uniref:Reverse transcriptase Ty1/copia-type domain-containing protein n=1 Tax=Hevea brasiliensis TaxID=3981 RepID=A0A6A6NGH5_HEVBR|nr:hypothetical protein GH714_011113 [Hevea brasiliensis]